MHAVIFADQVGPKTLVLTIDCARGTDSAGRGADARPLDPYTIRKRGSRAFQWCIIQHQLTSFTESVTPRVPVVLKMAVQPCMCKLVLLATPITLFTRIPAPAAAIHLRFLSTNNFDLRMLLV